MAMAYVALGDFDRAFEHLDRQLAARGFPGWLNSKVCSTDPPGPALAAFERNSTRVPRPRRGRKRTDGSARGHYPPVLAVAGEGCLHRPGGSLEAQAEGQGQGSRCA